MKIYASQEYVQEKINEIEIPAEVVIDATLSQAGQAADAKAVSDQLKQYVKSVNGTTPDENGNIVVAAKGVSSWSDLTDKPFGETVTPSTELLPVTQYNFEEFNTTYGLWGLADRVNYSLTIDETYIVSWDGEEYICVAQDIGRLLPNGVALGNGVAWGFVGNNEPFIIAYRTDEDYASYFSPTSGVHEVSIRATEIEIKQIEDKYISGTIARVSDIPSIESINERIDDVETSLTGQIHTVASTRPNWSQNDNTAMDYIKGRTHFMKPSWQVIFDGSVTTTDGWNAVQDDTISIEIYSGMAYEVVFDGITYELNAQVDGKGIPYIGSISLWKKQEYDSTEPPFCYGDGYFGAVDDGTHSVVISGTNIDWYVLDKHYIPGPLARYGTARGAEEFNYEGNVASGRYSHAEGYTTRATGDYAHAENYTSIAQGFASHAEGSGFTNNKYAHAEGYETSASGIYSHAEGSKSKSQALASHAEGFDTTASGQCAHAEGYQTVASGYQSHAEGLYSEARATSSHAEGKGTIAGSKVQHVQGQYNIIDSSDKYAHILGNGTKDDVKDENGNVTTQNRSNAHTIDWDGNAWFAGDVYVGGASQDDSNRLAKLSEVQSGMSTEIATLLVEILRSGNYSNDQSAKINTLANLLGVGGTA